MADNELSPKLLDERRAFRVNEAVAVYRLSRSTLYKLIAAGQLRTAKIGGRRLIPRDALEYLLNNSAHEPRTLPENEASK
jgi:excisionase family DNA binding protein